MELVEERQVKLIYHKFYCDKCGKFLGESCEDENGQYRNPYKFDLIHLCYYCGGEQKIETSTGTDTQVKTRLSYM